MSFFLPLIVIPGLLTCQALLVLHLGRFQQLQSSLSSSFSEATSFRSVEVAMDWKFHLNIVYKIEKKENKILETVKKELQYVKFLIL